MKRIIFVCTGNTCRSPMAEYLLRDLIDEHSGLELQVESAGVNAAPGSQASQPTRRLLGEEGVEEINQHRSRSVASVAPESGDLVLAMTRKHKDYLERTWPETGAEIYTLNEYIESRVDLTDPYGGSFDRYRELFEELKPALEELVNKLKTDLNQ